MRRCNSCGNIMDYDCVEDKWKCSDCGKEINKVTEHGDRSISCFEGWN